MAESLQFSIGADTKAFNDGIGGMITGLAGLAAAFVSVQAIVEAFSQAIDMGGRLHDLSTRTGETAGNLAILERAFENTSVGAEKLGPAIQKMQVNMVEMQKGSKEAVAAFTQLGISWDDLAGHSPAEQMQLIGERLAAIEDPALRANTAVKIFGRTGSELLPILMNFSSETEEARRQLGALPDQLDKTAEAVDSLGDNLSAIRSKLTEMAYGFLSEVVPAVNAFTNRLAGLDAASIGAGLADALVGAFAQPMKAAGLMSDVLILGAKNFGNELIFQARYWSDVLLNTFSIISGDIIPMLGNNMTGAFAMAAGTFGRAIADVLAPLADLLGLDFINELRTGSEDLMVQGAAKIAESANAFQSAMAEAQKNSTIIREDFFGVEGSSAKIQQDWESIQKSGKQLVDDLSSAEVSQRALAESRTMSGTTTDPLVSLLINENLVKQEPVDVAVTKAKTAAQIQAELNKQLSLIAGVSSTQVIGQSASAQRAIDKQKELDQLVAMGKGDSALAESLRASIQRNTDIALGDVLTSADRELAHQQALDDYFSDTTQSFSELEQQAQAEILAQKRGDTGTIEAQKAKAEAAGAGGKAAPPVSLTSIVNSIQSILQKIEPKIPTHIMS
jgi:hypothetical protein